MGQQGGGGDIEAFIRQKAQQYGIDPDTAVAVANSEGGTREWAKQSGFVYQGQQEQSFGPFQLLMQGGLGNAFQQETGLDPRDPQSGPAATDWALRYASQHGWGPWHGAQRIGLSDFAGIGGNPAEGTPTGPAPAQGATFGPDLAPAQFGQEGQATGVATAICGPIAAIAFARATGRAPTVAEALDIARQQGLWDEGSGMHGPAAEQALLEHMGVASRLDGNPSPDAVIHDVQNGNPVILSSPGHYHYFVVTGYDPQTGLFDTGNTGGALRGGSRYRTWDDIAPQAALFIDEPTSPAPSVAASPQQPQQYADMQRPAQPLANPTGQVVQQATAGENPAVQGNILQQALGTAEGAVSSVGNAALGAAGSVGTTLLSGAGTALDLLDRPSRAVRSAVDVRMQGGDLGQALQAGEQGLLGQRNASYAQMIERANPALGQKIPDWQVRAAFALTPLAGVGQLIAGAGGITYAQALGGYTDLIADPLNALPLLGEAGKGLQVLARTHPQAVAEGVRTLVRGLGETAAGHMLGNPAFGSMGVVEGGMGGLGRVRQGAPALAGGADQAPNIARDARAFDFGGGVHIRVAGNGDKHLFHGNEWLGKLPDDPQAAHDAAFAAGSAARSGNPIPPPSVPPPPPTTAAAGSAEDVAGGGAARQAPVTAVDALRADLQRTLGMYLNAPETSDADYTLLSNLRARVDAARTPEELIAAKNAVDDYHFKDNPALRANLAESPEETLRTAEYGHWRDRALRGETPPADVLARFPESDLQQVYQSRLRAAVKNRLAVLESDTGATGLDTLYRRASSLTTDQLEQMKALPDEALVGMARQPERFSELLDRSILTPETAPYATDGGATPPSPSALPPPPAGAGRSPVGGADSAPAAPEVPPASGGGIPAVRGAADLVPPEGPPPPAPPADLPPAPGEPPVPSNDLAAAKAKWAAATSRQGAQDEGAPLLDRIRKWTTDRDATLERVQAENEARGPANPQQLQQQVAQQAGVVIPATARSYEKKRLFAGVKAQVDAAITRLAEGPLAGVAPHWEQYKTAMLVERMQEVMHRFDPAYAKTFDDAVQHILAGANPPATGLEMSDRLADALKGVTAQYDLPAGMTPRDLALLYADARRTAGPAWDSVVRPAVDKTRAFLDDLLEQARDAGVLSDAELVTIRAKNQQYASLKRAGYINDNLASQGDAFGRGRGMDVASSGLKALEESGSLKPVYDLDLSLQAGVSKLVNLIERNKVARSIHADLSLHPDMGRFYRDLKPGDPIPSGWSEVHYMEGGKAERYAVAPWLSDVVLSTGPNQADGISRVARWMATPLRAGAVGFNWAFALKNVIRDPITATGNWGFGILPYLGEGALIAANSRLPASMRNEQLWEHFLQYMESGAGMSGMLETIGHQPAKLARVAGLPVDHGGGLVMRINDLAHFLSTPGEVSELMTRIGVHRYAQAKGFDPIAAAMMSRNSTFDMAKAGTLGRALNTMVPFVNSRWQSTLTTLTRLRDDPAAKYRIAAQGILPAMALIAWNEYGGEQRNEDFWDVPDYERQNNNVFVVGSRTDKDGRRQPLYVSVPRDTGQQVIYSAVEAAVRMMKQEDPDAWHTIAQQLVADISPFQGIDPHQDAGTNALSVTGELLPPPMRAGAQSLANYDFFRRRKIVPDSEADLPPEAQVGEYTTGGAKLIGKLPLVGGSPRKVETFISTTGGSVPMQALHLVDAAIRVATGGPVVPSTDAERLPALGSFVKSQGGQRDDNLDREYQRQYQASLADAYAALQQMPEYQQADQATQRSLTRSLETRLQQHTQARMGEKNLPYWRQQKLAEGEPPRIPIQWLPADLKAEYADQPRKLEYDISRATAEVQRWRSARGRFPTPDNRTILLYQIGRRVSPLYAQYRQQTARPAEQGRAALLDSLVPTG